MAGGDSLRDRDWPCPDLDREVFIKVSLAAVRAVRADCPDTQLLAERQVSCSPRGPDQLLIAGLVILGIDLENAACPHHPRDQAPGQDINACSPRRAAGAESRSRAGTLPVREPKLRNDTAPARHGVPGRLKIFGIAAVLSR